jgi:Ubiquitin carboxyl-terminal hydrolase
VSEAFTFITDKLALPLLTLKMDVYHTGKDDTDDHRIVRERLLDVAIPDPPEDAPESGYTIKLEDCLENYFNNKVEVKRYLQRRNTVNYGQSRPNIATLQEMETPERSTSRGMSSPPMQQVLANSRTASSNSIFRHRTFSPTEEGVITEEPELLSSISRDDIDVHPGRKESTSSARFRKEVVMPAWQFFHLIRKSRAILTNLLHLAAWSTNKPKPEADITTDAQVAAHFATKKPVLGICLKRYSFGVGNFKRLSTYVDIPLQIRLPHFFSDGTEDDGFGSSFSRFKLSLQSVICHRGVSLEMGHYVSLVRPNAEDINLDVEEGDHDPKFQWFMHDDLAKGKRITRVDIRKALKDETPYLLFYQVQPIGEYDDLELDDFPPSYAEATESDTTPAVGSESASTTMSMPSTVTLSTVMGTSPTSSPPLRAISNSLPEDILPISLSNHSSNLSHSNPELDTTNAPHVTVVVPPESPANDEAKNVSSSKPEHVQLDLSSLGFSLQNTPKNISEGSTLTGDSSEAVHDLRRNRFSFTTSDPSPLNSGPLTPTEDDKLGEDHAVESVDFARLNGTEPPASRTGSINKHSWRRKSKDGRSTPKDEESSGKDASTPSKERKHGSRWLGGSNTKPRSRPVSQAPGGLVKGLKEVMSRDKLSGSVHSAGQEDHGHAEAGSHENGSPIDSAAPSFTFVAVKDKEKEAKSDKPTRMKSLAMRKGKARKEASVTAVAIDGDAKSDVSNGDRQCALM